MSQTATLPIAAAPVRARLFATLSRDRTVDDFLPRLRHCPGRAGGEYDGDGLRDRLDPRLARSL